MRSCFHAIIALKVEAFCLPGAHFRVRDDVLLAVYEHVYAFPVSDTANGSQSEPWQPMGRLLYCGSSSIL